MSEIYENILVLLNKHEVKYQEFDHEAILSYEDAEREKQRLGWQGIESKNVFMKGKDGNYYLYVTTQGNRVDFKELKDVTGTNLSIASPEDVTNVIKCVPGCVTPFGFDEKIMMIIDNGIFQNSDYLFSPGMTTKTIQLNINDLKPIFAKLPNKIVYIH